VAVEHGTLKKRDYNRIQAAEMKYVETLKGFPRTGQLRNYVLSLLDLLPLHEAITEYGDKWKIHL
jgi:hypothetical protein